MDSISHHLDLVDVNAVTKSHRLFLASLANQALNLRLEELSGQE
jgi:hypothetical protein